MPKYYIPEGFLKKANTIPTYLEEKFLNIVTNYGIYTMVKGIYEQYWVRTLEGIRRIDFVFLIQDTEEEKTGLFIEVDGNQHKNQVYEDKIREREIYLPKFPIVRYNGFDLFERPEWVANDLERRIELLKG
jgi:hypothetical protein